MRFTAWLVLFATLLLWSGNWIVARAAREEIGPALATVGRLILVLAILLPFTFRGLTGKLPLLKRREWIVLASLGLAGGGPHLALQWLGLHYTAATSGILYLSVTPIFILLLAAPLGEQQDEDRRDGKVQDAARRRGVVQAEPLQREVRAAAGEAEGCK